MRDLDRNGAALKASAMARDALLRTLVDQAITLDPTAPLEFVLLDALILAAAHARVSQSHEARLALVASISAWATHTANRLP